MNLNIVIPCYNEAKRIPLKDYKIFLTHFPKVNLCFVNDGSSDTTAAILDAFKTEHPKQVQILNLTQNHGKGNAVREGMLVSLDHKSHDAYAFLDADLSTSLEECTLLAKKISPSKQFVFGSRIKKIDNRIERKLFRFIIGRMIATAISNVLQLAVYDTQCGCKVFSAENARIAFGNPFISPWLFDVEIFFRLKNHYGTSDFKRMSSEIPLQNWKDQGDSKIAWTYGFKMWMDLLKIKRTYR
tara:strand:+ start:248 stop:973 length:726 start_codon:yes stop_codon:yes gene_type:complete